jgi:hypothetical protein
MGPFDTNKYIQKHPKIPKTTSPLLSILLSLSPPSLSPSVLRLRGTQRVNLVLHVADALSRARHLINTVHPRELLYLELCAEEQGESGRGRGEEVEGGRGQKVETVIP